MRGNIDPWIYLVKFRLDKLTNWDKVIAYPLNSKDIDCVLCPSLITISLFRYRYLAELTQSTPQLKIRNPKICCFHGL